MHCIHLNVMKKMLSLWLDVNNKKMPYYIRKKNQVILSSRIVKIKPISEIIRKPKSLFQKGEFKANELRNLLLFYLPFALSGLLENKYVQHYRLLSYSVYTLSKKQISSNEIEIASQQLNEFRQQYQNLYGKSNVTMNLHLLSHIPMSVRKLGPLWATSAYSYEANNGVIIKGNTSKKDIVHQLAYKYVMRQTIELPINPTKQFSLSGEYDFKMSASEKELFSNKGIDIENKTLKMYRKIIFHHIIYTSEKFKNVTTIDYFLQMKNGVIVSVIYYILLESNLFALATLYEIIDEIAHFKKIQRTSTQEVMNINEISEKMMYIKLGINEFVTVLPNNYEKT